MKIFFTSLFCILSILLSSSGEVFAASTGNGTEIPPVPTAEDIQNQETHLADLDRIAGEACGGNQNATTCQTARTNLESAMRDYMQSRNSFLSAQQEAIANQEFDLSLLNITKFTNIFQLGDSIIAFAIRLIALFAVLSLILGGFWIMTAFGDEGRVDTGKKIILYGVIGLAIVLASYVIEYDFLKVLYSLGK